MYIQKPEESEKPAKKSYVIQIIVLVLIILGLVVFFLFMSLMDTVKDLH